MPKISIFLLIDKWSCIIFLNKLQTDYRIGQDHAFAHFRKFCLGAL